MSRTYPLSPYFNLTAQEVRQLMRKHGWTIRTLAAAAGVTMKRVRMLRNLGCEALRDYGRIRGFQIIGDPYSWREIITGRTP